ncbi:uncharacterized protein [Manis javanica]|uniref:uncharacterized protein n=1 Tax=Manis javanica TaxID=9974 RepID=UPI003C6CDA25
MSHVFKLQINVSRSAGRKRAGSLQLTLGKIRRPPARLDPLTAPAPPRDRPAFRLLGLSLSAELRGRVRLGGRGASIVNLAAQPHLRFSSWPGRGGEPGSLSGNPRAFPACLKRARGSLALGDAWYPRRKAARSPRRTLCLCPGRGSETGAHGALTLPGVGFRAPRGRLAETKLSNRRGERPRPWLGGGGGLLLSPIGGRREPITVDCLRQSSLLVSIHWSLDLHLLWRENNPLLSLIGFVVEVWGWIPLFVFLFSLPFNCDPPAPIPKEDEGR